MPLGTIPKEILGWIVGLIWLVKLSVSLFPIELDLIKKAIYDNDAETLKQYYIQGGQKNNCSKTYVYDIEGNFINEFETRTQAAEFAGTDKKQLSKCFRTDKWKRKQINGFRFSNEKFNRLPPL